MIVLLGPGMPTTSERRPSNVAGPTFRQRMPAIVAESSACANIEVAPERASSASASSGASEALRKSRDDFMEYLRVGRRDGVPTVTVLRWRLTYR
jgi:hypothetical protein